MRLLLLYLFVSGVIFNSFGADFQGGWVVGWGNNLGGQATGIYPFKFSTNKAEMLAQINNPKLREGIGTVTLASQTLYNVTAIVSGSSYSLAVKSNGHMIGWGWNQAAQGAAPTNLDDVVGVAMGDEHGLALKKDGHVLVWGDKRHGAVSAPEDLSNVVTIAAGGENSLALKKDGTIAGWGVNIKIAPGLSNITAIAVSSVWLADGGHGGHALALKANGTVINLQWDDIDGRANLQSGLSNVVAISCGPVNDLALKQDGTVAAWGINENGELNIPVGLTNVVAIAAGGTDFEALGFSLALKSDGQIAAWGRIGTHPANVPEGLSNVVAIAAGKGYCLAITTNGAVAERFRPK